MNPRQDRILTVLSSIAVGTMAFCLTVPMAMILGSILFAPWLRSDVLVPTELVILLLVSTLSGLATAIFVGIKYHRHIEKKTA